MNQLNASNVDSLPTELPLSLYSSHHDISNFENEDIAKISEYESFFDPLSIAPGDHETRDDYLITWDEYINGETRGVTERSIHRTKQLPQIIIGKPAARSVFNRDVEPAANDLIEPTEQLAANDLIEPTANDLIEPTTEEPNLYEVTLEDIIYNEQLKQEVDKNVSEEYVEQIKAARKAKEPHYEVTLADLSEEMFEGDIVDLTTLSEQDALHIIEEYNKQDKQHKEFKYNTSLNKVLFEEITNSEDKEPIRYIPMEKFEGVAMIEYAPKFKELLKAANKLIDKRLTYEYPVSEYPEHAVSEGAVSRAIAKPENKYMPYNPILTENAYYMTKEELDGYKTTHKDFACLIGRPFKMSTVNDDDNVYCIDNVNKYYENYTENYINGCAYAYMWGKGSGSMARVWTIDKEGRLISWTYEFAKRYCLQAVTNSVPSDATLTGDYTIDVPKYGVRIHPAGSYTGSVARWQYDYEKGHIMLRSNNNYRLWYKKQPQNKDYLLCLPEGLANIDYSTLDCFFDITNVEESLIKITKPYRYAISKAFSKDIDSAELYRGYEDTNGVIYKYLGGYKFAVDGGNGNQPFDMKNTSLIRNQINVPFTRLTWDKASEMKVNYGTVTYNIDIKDPYGADRRCVYSLKINNALGYRHYGKEGQDPFGYIYGTRIDFKNSTMSTTQETQNKTVCLGQYIPAPLDVYDINCDIKNGGHYSSSSNVRDFYGFKLTNRGIKTFLPPKGCDIKFGLQWAVNWLWQVVAAPMSLFLNAEDANLEKYYDFSSVENHLSLTSNKYSYTNSNNRDDYPQLFLINGDYYGRSGVKGSPLNCGMLGKKDYELFGSSYRDKISQCFTLNQQGYMIHHSFASDPSGYGTEAMVVCACVATRALTCVNIDNIMKESNYINEGAGVQLYKYFAPIIWSINDQGFLEANVHWGRVSDMKNRQSSNGEYINEKFYIGLEEFKIKYDKFDEWVNVQNDQSQGGLSVKAGNENISLIKKPEPLPDGFEQHVSFYRLYLTKKASHAHQFFIFNYLERMQFLDRPYGISTNLLLEQWCKSWGEPLNDIQSAMIGSEVAGYNYDGSNSFILRHINEDPRSDETPDKLPWCVHAGIETETNEYATGYYGACTVQGHRDNFTLNWCTFMMNPYMHLALVANPNIHFAADLDTSKVITMKYANWQDTLLSWWHGSKYNDYILTRKQCLRFFCIKKEVDGINMKSDGYARLMLAEDKAKVIYTASNDEYNNQALTKGANFLNISDQDDVSTESIVTQPWGYFKLIPTKPLKNPISITYELPTALYNTPLNMNRNHLVARPQIVKKGRITADHYWAKPGCQIGLLVQLSAYNNKYYCLRRCEDNQARLWDLDYADINCLMYFDYQPMPDNSTTKYYMTIRAFNSVSYLEHLGDTPTDNTKLQFSARHTGKQYHSGFDKTTQDYGRGMSNVADSAIWIYDDSTGRLYHKNDPTSLIVQQRPADATYDSHGKNLLSYRTSSISTIINKESYRVTFSVLDILDDKVLQRNLFYITPSTHADQPLQNIGWQCYHTPISNNIRPYMHCFNEHIKNIVLANMTHYEFVSNDDNAWLLLDAPNLRSISFKDNLQIRPNVDCIIIDYGASYNDNGLVYGYRYRFIQDAKSSHRGYAELMCYNDSTAGCVRPMHYPSTKYYIIPTFIRFNGRHYLVRITGKAAGSTNDYTATTFSEMTDTTHQNVLGALIPYQSANPVEFDFAPFKTTHITNWRWIAYDNSHLERMFLSGFINTTNATTLNTIIKSNTNRLRFIELPEGFGYNPNGKLQSVYYVLSNLVDTVSISVSPWFTLKDVTTIQSVLTLADVKDTLKVLRCSRSFLERSTGNGAWSGYGATIAGPNDVEGSTKYQSYNIFSGTAMGEFINNCNNYLGSYNTSSLHPIDIIYTIPKAWSEQMIDLSMDEGHAPLHGHLNTNASIAFYYGGYHMLNTRNICFGDSFELEGNVSEYVEGDEVFDGAGTYMVEYRKEGSGSSSSSSNIKCNELKWYERNMIGSNVDQSWINTFATSAYTTNNKTNEKKRITVNNAFTFVGLSHYNSPTKLRDGLVLHNKDNANNSTYNVTKLKLQCISYSNIYNRDISKKYGRVYRLPDNWQWWTGWTDASSYEGDWLQMHANNPNIQDLRIGYIDYSNLGSQLISNTDTYVWCYRHNHTPDYCTYSEDARLINCLEIQNFTQWSDLKSDLAMSDSTKNFQTTFYLDWAMHEMYSTNNDSSSAHLGYFDRSKEPNGYTLNGDVEIYNEQPTLNWVFHRRPYIQSPNFILRININGITNNDPTHAINFHWVMQNWRSTFRIVLPEFYKDIVDNIIVFFDWFENKNVDNDIIFSPPNQEASAKLYDFFITAKFKESGFVKPVRACFTTYKCCKTFQFSQNKEVDNLFKYEANTYTMTKTEANGKYYYKLISVA